MYLSTSGDGGCPVSLTIVQDASKGFRGTPNKTALRTINLLTHAVD